MGKSLVALLAEKKQKGERAQPTIQKRMKRPSTKKVLKRPAATKVADVEPSAPSCPEPKPKLDGYPIPRTAAELGSWAQVTLRRCVEFFGEEYCCFRLQQEQEIMTMFSGIECARKSWEYIESAAMEILGITTGVTFTCAVEKDKTCQRWLQQCYPTSCLFPDVLKLIHNEIPQDRVLSPAEVRFRNKAHCLTHGRDCRIPLNKNSRLVLGAPCVLFSRLGKRESFANIGKAQVHAISTGAMNKVCSCLHENVQGYDSTMLDESCSHTIEEAKLFPQLFGYPSARPREYRCTWDGKVATWKAEMTFQQYIDMILAPKHIPLNLTPACFAISHPEEIMMVCGANAEQSLPPSMKTSLAQYRASCPEKVIFDLGQSVKDKRGRVNLKRGELPTLATSSRYLRSEELKRCFTGREKLFSLGYPVWGPACAAGTVDKVTLPESPEFNEGFLT